MVIELEKQSFTLKVMLYWHVAVMDVLHREISVSVCAQC